MRNPQQAGGTVGVSRIFRWAKTFVCSGVGENRPGTQPFRGQRATVARLLLRAAAMGFVRSMLFRSTCPTHPCPAKYHGNPDSSRFRYLVFQTWQVRCLCIVGISWVFQSVRVCLLIFQHYSLELPNPNKLSKLVKRLKIETNKLTVAKT